MGYALTRKNCGIKGDSRESVAICPVLFLSSLHTAPPQCCYYYNLTGTGFVVVPYSLRVTTTTTWGCLFAKKEVDMFPKIQPASVLILLPFLLFACSSANAVSNPADCPVTTPDDPETDLYGPEGGLRVFINEGGWVDLPQDEHGYFNKVFWKYPGYSVTEDPRPDLKVSGKQLDGTATFIEKGPATNAFGNPDLLGDAILTGVSIPKPGCWQLTGEYRESQLTFVVWVGD